MKKSAFLLFLFLSSQVFSQNINDVQKQIDSLRDVKKDYEAKISNLDIKISELEANKSTLKFKDVEGIDYMVNQKIQIKIREKDNTSGKIIAEPRNGEKLNLVDYIEGTGYWVVLHNAKNGYVNEILITSNPSIEEFKKNLINKRAQSNIQGNLQGQARIRQNLIKEFGVENADGILNHQYWIGMTDAMARRSLGSPDKINTDVGSWGTHEQWVYEKRDLYLYFENGNLTSYQNN
jgi:hypothetical protein